jgi:hypothetical protein
MKQETLTAILNALPDGAIEQIVKMSGKSKTTVYNVFKKVHRGEAVLKAALKIIEDKAINDVKLVSDAQKEITESYKSKVSKGRKPSKPRQLQQKQAA